MSKYYEESYYERGSRFPWFVMIIVMAIAAIGGGLFSYYLLDGQMDAKLAELKNSLPKYEQTVQVSGNIADSVNDSPSTVVNTTQMVLSEEAMQALLAQSGSSTMVDLIYGEIANIYEQASPSIVGISNIINYNSYYNSFGFGNRQDNAIREIEQSSGSGVIYSTDGYIVTNYHVIEGADRIAVTLYDGSTENAEVIGYDARTDLALIKIDRKELPAAKFGTSEGLRVGDFTMAIGNPGGETFSRSLTTGTVSGLNRIVSTTEGLQLSMIQTDAAINPGNSGGALVNSKGEVIGINTVKISSTAYEGMGFAIPVDTMQEILSDLITYKKVLRPALGVQKLRDIDAAFAQYNKLSVEQGVLISPAKGGAAEAAGLQEYDIILAIDGKEVLSFSELQNIVFSYQIGDTVTVKVHRYTDNETFDVKITLGELE